MALERSSILPPGGIQYLGRLPTVAGTSRYRFRVEAAEPFTCTLDDQVADQIAAAGRNLVDVLSKAAPRLNIVAVDGDVRLRPSSLAFLLS